MVELDRVTARAFVEAGYMPLSVYVEMFEAGGHDVADATLVPDHGPAREDHTGRTARETVPH